VITSQPESIWSHAESVDVAQSLASYLKFLKTKPPLDEIFFYLQSTFLLDYGFDALCLYVIDSKSNLTCVASTGTDVLAEQGISTLSEIKKIIPPMLPTAADPMTDCILSYDEALIFFPFSRHTAVDAFFLHHAPGKLKEEAKASTALKFLSLIQALTAHHLVLSGILIFPELHSVRDTSTIILSERQKKILTGMIDAKTNHQLAQDLGFSVSTIRHETIAIYLLLDVLDRKEAAKLAIKLNLV
jgi:DNA-binding CsgD family transcriptional regulator